MKLASWSGEVRQPGGARGLPSTNLDLGGPLDRFLKGTRHFVARLKQVAEVKMPWYSVSLAEKGKLIEARGWDDCRGNVMVEWAGRRGPR